MLNFLKFILGRKKEKLQITDYTSNIVATLLLSCGEGEQLGHPGRTVTRKPRAVDTFPPDTKFIQVNMILNFKNWYIKVII